ncbi:hypothetical protein ASG67_09930 [Sphingomonas sp. Leaf339]|uniref:TetR/AcrR family transcriptional regulator n=1 Tax=Sphingomonas sp. Leaf339 TaxID=1736343 RepID=UPI0006FB30C3|nr:TetR/AcrR family transcriptional regulator [Sphingomonas sp. Leaf339]KQU53137.1 hypothetical protein ASG67_09930 [Sphingomonas sp. Leaf339]
MFVKKDAAVHNAEIVDVTGPAETNRAAIRRNKVVESARTLFAEHGFHGTGIAQIATTSGIKVGQIYRDFACKEDIVAAIAEQNMATLLDEEGLRQAIDRRDLAAVRTWMIDLILRKTTPDDASLMPELLAESARNERINAIMLQCDARIRQNAVRALCQAVPDAADDRVAIAADLMMMVMMGVCCRRIALVQDDPAQMDSGIRLFIDQQIASLSDA